jgi:hypothetical protein
VLLGPLAVLHQPLEVAPEAGAEPRLPQLVRREQPGLDALAELDLLDGGEQRDLADLRELGADEVRAGGGRVEGVRGLPEGLDLGGGHELPPGAWCTFYNC